MSETMPLDDQVAARAIAMSPAFYMPLDDQVAAWAIVKHQYPTLAWRIYVRDTDGDVIIGWDLPGGYRAADPRTLGVGWDAAEALRFVRSIVRTIPACDRIYA